MRIHIEKHLPPGSSLSDLHGPRAEGAVPGHGDDNDGSGDDGAGQTADLSLLHVPLLFQVWCHHSLCFAEEEDKYALPVELQKPGSI